jgi:[amino group carrier protein]-lysine/ornithine hydrolase
MSSARQIGTELDPVELLHRMVEIESLSGKEKELAVFLVERMQAAGFESFIDEAGNAVGVRTSTDTTVSSDSARDIVLLGHMDTVPGRVPVRFSGDRLYGRGAVDAKGPLAAFIAAASQVEPAPGCRFIVIGAVEEEAATSRGARHIVGRYSPQGCIIGEPSGWDAITLGYKGRLLADYRLERSVSHTAGPDAAVAEAAVEWWNGLRDFATRFNQDKEKVFDHLLPSLRRIQTSTDGLTDVVEATVGMRLPPGFDIDSLEATLSERAGEAKVRFYGREVAFQSERNSQVARAFVKSIRLAGGNPRFKMKTGTSDMNVVGPVWGCPIVAYGPGDSRLDHTPNEHIEIPEFLRAIQVLTQLLQSTG